MVTDKLQVDPDELNALYKGVRFGDSRLDLRLLYEVSRFKFSDDEEDYDSSDGSDQESSDSDGKTATSPSGLSSAFNFGKN